MPTPLPAPIRRLFDECESGFTVARKVKLTLLLGLYLVSPIDLLPEFIPFFGLIDDGIALVLLLRVWVSPTLGAASSAASSVLASREASK